MTTLQEKNKAVVQRYFEEYWGKGNVDVVDEVCADNFVIDYPMHGPRRGKAAAKNMLLEFREVASLPSRIFRPLILTNSQGLSKHFLPFLQIPSDCGRRLRRWALDWRRQAYWGRV